MSADVKEIGREAFRGCADLSSVEFASGSRLELVQERAFEGTAIRAFYCPENLKELGDLAFCECGSLAEVSLNEKLHKLGKMCFLGTQVKEI